MHNSEEINGEAVITVKDKVNLTSTEEKDQLSSKQYTPIPFKSYQKNFLAKMAKSYSKRSNILW